jgi:hypothetical protein
MEKEVKLLNRRIFALAAVAALFVLAGTFAGALPASANGPRNQFQYPMVMGVNGSSMSSEEMGLTPEQLFFNNMQRVPWVMASPEAYAVAFWRWEPLDRDYAAISGQYCKNKSGNDVFMATGAPADPSLTC